MRKILVLFLALLMFSFSYSQVHIKGTVKGAKGTAVHGASISVKDSYDGTISDSTGAFSFTTSEKGSRVLQVSSVGYKPFEQKVELNEKEINLTITLKEEINELKAVVITAGAFEASDRKKATVLSSLDIVTTASANADITGAIKTLPGAQQVGETEGLFVRGGTAAETKTFIDGTLVNNFFYTSVPDIAQRGRFSPFIFKGTVFTAGGYSALYGQALSSALILESIDLPERSSANLSVSPIGGGAGLQKLNKKKNASWGVNYSYTNVFLAFKLLHSEVDYFHMPEFHTVDANFRIKTSKSGMLKYYGYYSFNHLGVRRPSLDTIPYNESFELRNNNMYHNLSYKDNLGHKWKFTGGASYANNKDVIAGNMEQEDNSAVLIKGLEYKNFNLSTNGNFINAKAVFERRLPGLSAVRFGSEYNYSDETANYTLYTGQKYSFPLKEHLVSLFAEGDVYLTNALAAKIGGRLEHSAVLNKYNAAPRISLAYKTGKESQASLAYGIFYQTPERKYLPAVADLSFTRATHYIAQYQLTTAKRTFRAELFYKKYEDLIKTTFINNRETASSNKGSGYAQGLEIFWRDKQTFQNLDYWVSYSYLDTKRDFLNYPYAIRPPFAAPHTANLVVKKFVTKLKTQFNANYVIASGRPYYNIRYDNASGKFNIYDEGRTIPYNSLSFSVNYLPDVFKKGGKKFTVFVFSITNVLGSKQVYGYNYSYNGLRKEAVIPTTKTFVYIGAFFSFGVDRSEDVINSNL
jgi:vitamin B12 transporter